MRKILVRKILIFILVLGGGLYFSLSFFGIIFNESNSLAKGVYRKVNDKPQVGDLIAFCPPKESIFFEAKKRGYIKAGLCEGGLGLMLKQILAAKNDVVLINDQGIFVNGEFIENSKPFTHDGQGRVMSKYFEDSIISENEIIVFGNNSAGSFDSRYFGSISQDKIVSVVKPLWLW